MNDSSDEVLIQICKYLRSRPIKALVCTSKRMLFLRTTQTQERIHYEKSVLFFSEYLVHRTNETWKEFLYANKYKINCHTTLLAYKIAIHKYRDNIKVLRKLVRCAVVNNHSYALSHFKEALGQTCRELLPLDLYYRRSIRTGNLEALQFLMEIGPTAGLTSLEICYFAIRYKQEHIFLEYVEYIPRNTINHIKKSNMFLQDMFQWDNLVCAYVLLPRIDREFDANILYWLIVYGSVNMLSLVHNTRPNIRWPELDYFEISKRNPYISIPFIDYYHKNISPWSVHVNRNMNTVLKYSRGDILNWLPVDIKINDAHLRSAIKHCAHNPSLFEWIFDRYSGYIEIPIIADIFVKGDIRMLKYVYKNKHLIHKDDRAKISKLAIIQYNCKFLGRENRYLLEGWE